LLLLAKCCCSLLLLLIVVVVMPTTTAATVTMPASAAVTVSTASALCRATTPARISHLLRTCLALVHAARMPAAAASPLLHPFITHLASAVALRARESEALVLLFYF
jgi:hypothetical protein